MTIGQHPRRILERRGMAARKSWGQNFLHDPTVHAAIVRACHAAPGHRVVEIGAGLGTLTKALHATGCDVLAIERDRDLCHVLRDELADCPRVTLAEADAVTFDYGAVEPGTDGTRPTIVGNLPYQLTGPLLFALLRHHARTGPWVVMVQREVADRLLSAPGSKRYGGVTVVLSRVRTIERVVEVGRHCFVPAPRVDSTVLALRPRPAPLGDVGDPEAFARLVRACFQQRRKTLLNALSAVAGTRERARAWCQDAGVDPQLRPERLSPVEFAALARAREADERATAVARQASETHEPSDQDDA